MNPVVGATGIVGTQMQKSYAGLMLGYASAALLATSPLRGLAGQPGNSPVASFKPYPGAIEFCREHVTGAPEGAQRPGAHISWTGYYSTDTSDKVVSYYTKLLGAKNHQREGDEDIWRFPLERPERVLTVSPPGGTFPLGQCKRPPGSARAIVIASIMTRPD